MMSISDPKNAAGIVAYHLHLAEDAHLPGGQRLREDYYSSEGAGIWHGSASARLGLSGSVSPDDFKRLAEGYSPSGEALVQNAGDPERRAAWDLTFSAPKDVSVLWAVADRETRDEIERVHDRAVAETLRELEGRFGFTRRGQGGHETEKGGMVFAVFRHGTSRDLDPQLHSHAVALNLVAREDGSFGTLETREIYSHQKVIGAIYRAHLAHGLAKMGFQVVREGESFGIAGVPRELRDEWSKARQRIEAEMARLGASGAKAAEMANLATRSKKNHEVTPEALREGWQAHAREHGFSRQEVEKIRAHDFMARLEKPDAKAELREAAERKAVLSDKEIEYQALVATVGQGREAARQFDQEMKREAVVLVDLEKKRVVRYSTHEMVRVERDLMRMIQRGRSDERHKLAEEHVRAAISRFEASKGIQLSQEQKRAVLHLTARAGRDAVLVGDAGTGKSTSMEAVREAYQAAGYKVVGLAPTGKAAAGLEQSTGIQSKTIDSYLSQVERSKAPAPDAKTVVILDEAGMVDSRRLHSLREVLERGGAKLILVGDHKQLQPIAAGAAFRHAAQVLGHARLEEIRRQRDAAERRAVAAMSRGEAVAAMRHYIEQERVAVRTTHAKACQEIARRYIKAADQVGKDKTLAMASTNARVRDVNQAVRDALKVRGELQNGREYMAAREVEVRDPKTRETRTGIVKERMELAPGDRVIYAGANDYKSDLRRGDLGTVVRCGEKSVTVRLDRDGREREIDLAKKDLRHGYCITTHRAQGATVERAIVYASADVSREMAYVQASRAREATEWVATAQTVKAMEREAGREPGEAARGMTKEEQLLARLKDVVEAMEKSRQATSTLDYHAPGDRAREREAEVAR